MHPVAFEEQVADREAAKMRGVGSTARVPNRREERNRAHDGDEDLRRNREQQIHVDRPVRKIQRIRQQEAVNGAGCANDVAVEIQLLREPERQQRKQHRQDAGADPGDEIELEKVARSPDSLELGPEHPQGQHVEEDVEDAAVQKHVRGELPQPELVQDERRHEPKIGDHALRQHGRDQIRQHKHRDVCTDQRLQCGGDRTRTERERRDLRGRVTAHVKVQIVLHPMKSFASTSRLGHGSSNFRTRTSASASISSNSAIFSALATPTRTTSAPVMDSMRRIA